MRFSIGNYRVGLLTGLERTFAFGRGDACPVQEQVGLHEQGICPSVDGGQLRTHHLQLRGSKTVFEARLELDVDFNLASIATKHPDELPVRIDRFGLLGLRGLADGQAVRQDENAAVGLEPGLQDVGVGQVAARGPVRSLRADAEMAAARPVQKPGEHRPRVETVKAAPIDRAIKRHEGRRMTVADERVRGNGWVGTWTHESYQWFPGGIGPPGSSNGFFGLTERLRFV